jgi:RNA polymerase sigma-70 factor (ECF subfamily)
METQADHREDQELVRAALAGDARAVDALVQRLSCVPRILRLLNRRMGAVLGPEDLSDVTQDTLALLWPRIRDYTGRVALESWAYGYCFNGLMNAVRRIRRRAAGTLEADELESSSRDGTSLDHDALQRGLDRLDERAVRVIRLKYYDGLTFDEIAARLGVAPSTVKSVHYRGMSRLKTILHGEDER